MVCVISAYCHFNECCEPSWTNHSIADTEAYLRENVFGQHLVQDIVVKVILEHRKDRNPKKPLVLSFHGSTGTGKNYVSGIIAEKMYKKGLESKYVHMIISSHEFPDKNSLGEYKKKLKKMLIAGIKKCAYSLFVIDELDKMPPGLVNTLKPYLDYNNKVDGYDFRKAIFIFMGNTGVEEINEVALDFFKAGKPRENITMKSMNKLLKTVSYHSGGLSSSTLIEHHMIDFHVPFLPLERKHVRMCAKVDMLKTGKIVTDEKVIAIANELEYFPKDIQVFSVSGCKNVKKYVQVFC